MLDIRILREDPERARASQVARGEDPAVIDAILSADSSRRAASTVFDTARAAQKELGRSIGPLQGKVKSGKATADETAELDALMAQATALAAQVTQAEDAQRAAEEQFIALMAQVPNFVDTRAPVGGEDDFVTLEHVGTPRDFAAEGFEPKDHLDLGALHKAIDVERGAKVSGSRFYYLTGVGAELEFALVNYAMDTARKHGFIPAAAATAPAWRTCRR